MTRFGHLAALMWARLTLGRFRDVVLTLIFVLSRALSLMSFPLTLVVGYIVVDMSQGLRLFAAFGFVFSLYRN